MKRSNHLGKIGEELVSKKIKKYGKVKNNLTIEYEPGRTTQIDHILITKRNIFVIETKHYSGKIKEYPGNYWYQKTKNGRYRLFNPIFQNQAHVNVISSLLSISRNNVINLVVFSGSAKMKTKSKNVIKLKDLKKYIKKHDKGKKKNFKIKRLNQFLLKKSKKTDKKHIKNLKR